jgi:hypothetical protein
LINIYQTVQHHTPDDSILYTPWIMVTATDIPERIYITLKITVTGVCICELQFWDTYWFYSQHNVILNCHWQDRIATVINMLSNKVYPVTDKYFLVCSTD